jgi:hypothetical protein
MPAVASQALTREVSALRCGLDYQSWTGPRCSDLLKIAYTRADHDTFGKPLPFNLGRSHELFGQIESLIKDKRLLIVPSGPITQLPFQVLVTEPPKPAIPSTFVGYRDAAWLARKHATTVLPAVSSLKALRALAKESPPASPTSGSETHCSTVNLKSIQTTRSGRSSRARSDANRRYASLWRPSSACAEARAG